MNNINRCYEYSYNHNKSINTMTTYEKISAILEEQEKCISSMKNAYDTMKLKQKQLKKLLVKLEQKSNKKQKPKPARKPCGFARPSIVSNELCDFMKLPHESAVSRTEVTKALVQYIKEHNLQNQANKRQILPDERLYQLFGEEARKTDITYFTMQKFMNKHFVSAVKKE